MFIEVEKNIINIDEVCAVTDIEALKMVKSVCFIFTIVFKSGKSVEIDNANKSTLEQIRAEFITKLKHRG